LRKEEFHIIKIFYLKKKETHYLLDKSAIVLEEMNEMSKIKICSGCCFNSMNTQRNLEKIIERKLKI
jgi:hypothetical protein